MKYKLETLSRWVEIAEGEINEFYGDTRRKFTMSLVGEGVVVIHDEKGKVTLPVNGTADIEAYVEGGVSVTALAGQVSFHTRHNAALPRKVDHLPKLTKMHEKQTRNYELERLVAMSMENTNRRMRVIEAQNASLAAEVNKREIPNETKVDSGASAASSPKPDDKSGENNTAVEAKSAEAAEKEPATEAKAGVAAK